MDLVTQEPDVDSLDKNGDLDIDDKSDVSFTSPSMKVVLQRAANVFDESPERLLDDKIETISYSNSSIDDGLSEEERHLESFAEEMEKDLDFDESPERLLDDKIETISYSNSSIDDGLSEEERHLESFAEEMEKDLEDLEEKFIVDDDAIAAEEKALTQSNNGGTVENSCSQSSEAQTTSYETVVEEKVEFPMEYFMMQLHRLDENNEERIKKLLTSQLTHITTCHKIEMNQLNMKHESQMKQAQHDATKKSKQELKKVRKSLESHQLEADARVKSLELQLDKVREEENARVKALELQIATMTSEKSKLVPGMLEATKSRELKGQVDQDTTSKNRSEPERTQVKTSESKVKAMTKESKTEDGINVDVAGESEQQVGQESSINMGPNIDLKGEMNDKQEMNEKQQIFQESNTNARLEALESQIATLRYEKSRLAMELSEIKSNGGAQAHQVATNQLEGSETGQVHPKAEVNIHMEAEIKGEGTLVVGLNTYEGGSAQQQTSTHLEPLEIKQELGLNVDTQEQVIGGIEEHLYSEVAARLEGIEVRDESGLNVNLNSHQQATVVNVDQHGVQGELNLNHHESSINNIQVEALQFQIDTLTSEKLMLENQLYHTGIFLQHSQNANMNYSMKVASMQSQMNCLERNLKTAQEQSLQWQRRCETFMQNLRIRTRLQFEYEYGYPKLC